MTYEARTFSSMIDSGSDGIGSWARLVDWDEAVCYALVVAQNTGHKVRIIKSRVREGWLAYETEQDHSYPRASIHTKIIRTGVIKP